GGGGAGGGNVNLGQPGTPGNCSGPAGGGTGEVPAENSGGAGGFDRLAPSPGQAKLRGGGGGGGAVGRVHIREVLDDPSTFNTRIVPPANRTE
nr:hypothetical protein [Deltaproteobacteria bacterium]